MPTIDIYCHDHLIGEAALDEIDAGMGVASGPFHPSVGYAQVRQQITAAAEARHQGLEPEVVELVARTKAGDLLTTGFVVIDDFDGVDVDPEASIQFADREQWLRIQKSGV